MSGTDGDISNWTSDQYKLLIALCSVTSFVYSIALVLAFRNVIYIWKLGIRKTLILTLYFFVINKEISTAVWIIAFTISPTSDWDSFALWMWYVSMTFDIGVYVTVILTNFRLASSI